MVRSVGGTVSCRIPASTSLASDRTKPDNVTPPNLAAVPLLAAFAALVLQGVLYTLSDHPAWLVGVQMQDGVGAGLTGALFPVVVAELTRGSGHFNAAGGTVGTVHAVGGILSGALAGQVVVLAGYQAAYLTLAAIAALGTALFWMAMPETRAVATLHPG